MNNVKNDFIQYDFEYVCNIKDNYKILPIELEKKYIECYEEIKTSENYLHIKKMLGSMIKIKDINNYSELDRIKMDIISLLNKLTDNNFEIIKDKLLKIKINKLLLYYLVDNIFIKVISENKYKKNYFQLIEYIIYNHNYFLNNEINFYILIINLAQDKFNLILNKNFFENLKSSVNNDIDYYFKEKKQLIGCVEFIGFLYNSKLLSNEIIDFVISKLLENDDIKMEILCSLIFIINKNGFYNSTITKIINMYKLNNSRIIYIIENLSDNKFKNDTNGNVINNNIKIKKPNIKIIINNEMKLKNLIKEHLIHKNENESIDYLQSFIKNYNNFFEDFIYILLDLNENEFNIIINLLLKIISLIKKLDINDLINNFNSNLEEFLLDYPFTLKYYEILLNKLVKEKKIDNLVLKKSLSIINEFK